MLFEVKSEIVSGDVREAAIISFVKKRIAQRLALKEALKTILSISKKLPEALRVLFSSGKNSPFDTNDKEIVQYIVLWG